LPRFSVGLCVMLSPIVFGFFPFLYKDRNA